MSHRTNSEGGDSRSPTVSIVVPAYNHGRFLDRMLTSVKAQSFADWECVVVDDGSTDDTATIGERHASADGRVRVAKISNGGVSRARNHGFALTNPTTEFVTFMDSDDVWCPDALDVLLARIESDPDAIGAHGLAEMVDVDDLPVPNWSHAAFGRSRLGLEGRRLIEWPPDRPTTFEVLINGNVLFPPGLVLARRTAYEQAGRFDEALRAGEDWDMLIRLSRFGYLSFVDRVIIRYRRHEANIGARRGVAEQAWLVRCKGFHSPDNDPRQRRIARLGWRAYQARLMRQRLEFALSVRKPADAGAALGALVRLPVGAARWIRGYPRPIVERASKPWSV